MKYTYKQVQEAIRWLKKEEVPNNIKDIPEAARESLVNHVVNSVMGYYETVTNDVQNFIGGHLSLEGMNSDPADMIKDALRDVFDVAREEMRVHLAEYHPSPLYDWVNANFTFERIEDIPERQQDDAISALKRLAKRCGERGEGEDYLVAHELTQIADGKLNVSAASRATGRVCNGEFVDRMWKNARYLKGVRRPPGRSAEKGSSSDWDR